MSVEYVVVLVLGGVVGVCGWRLLNPECPDCGVRRPVLRYVVAAVLVGLVVGAWVMG